MFYLIITLLLLPILQTGRLLGLKRKGGKLIIQTAKIGDFINTTPLIAACKKTDVLISKINSPLAKHDQHIEKIFEIEKYKEKKLGKWHLIWKLYILGYDEIFVVMPNAFNLCAARLSCAKKTASLHVLYRRKWYTDQLLKGFSTTKHHKQSLALQSYLNLLNERLTTVNYPKYATSPLFIPKNPFQTRKPGLNVGISLSAGNPLKTLPKSLWKKIAEELLKQQTYLWVFGLEYEGKLLNEFHQYTSFPKNKIIDMTGKAALHELPYYISLLDFYISSDTGNSYIADALNIPLINFMGPCNAAEQRPLGKQALVLQTPNLKPFSFIFQAPYSSDLPPEKLYNISEQQWQKIKSLISTL